VSTHSAARLVWLNLIIIVDNILITIIVVASTACFSALQT
jgi:hypothetical protein